MKKTYSLEFEIVMLSDEDVIRTSGMLWNVSENAFSGFDAPNGDDVWDLG